MIELIATIIVAVASFFLGMLYREWQAVKKLNKYMDLVSSIEEEVRQNMVRVHIVKEGDTFLVYNKKTNEFLAQGKNQQEIKDLLGKRYPTMFFDADLENIKEVGWHDPK